ncbi:hypothetical protein [Tianweitania sediminis]|uniref:Uncharacterized protein n=1 Tax=Tianweitania sediminis TaxID=1502156 RepID=A0A8J7QZD1_9HYPH|nr:hypothetical protein [Tianweitania sediminis]MBP0439583.1 hypothetical protein [Tianweitania sediminis]
MIVAGVIVCGLIGSFASAAETYRLIHAIGNSETLIAKGLSKNECARMKQERLKIIALTGVGGSVSCLPESVFLN